MMNTNKGTVFSPGKFPENNTQLWTNRFTVKITHYYCNILYVIKTLIKLLSVVICYILYDFYNTHYTFTCYMSSLIHKKEAFSESYEVILPPCVAWSTADRDQGVASFISLASLASLVSLASLATLASLASLCSATPSLLSVFIVALLAPGLALGRGTLDLLYSCKTFGH